MTEAQTTARPPMTPPTMAPVSAAGEAVLLDDDVLVGSILDCVEEAAKEAVKIGAAVDDDPAVDERSVEVALDEADVVVMS